MERDARPSLPGTSGKHRTALTASIERGRQRPRGEPVETACQARRAAETAKRPGAGVARKNDTQSREESSDGQEGDASRPLSRRTIVRAREQPVSKPPEHLTAIRAEQVEAHRVGPENGILPSFE